MKKQITPILALIASLFLGAACLNLSPPTHAADAADSATNYNRIGEDISDLYVFPSPTNISNVVLVMDVDSFIPAGQGQSASFDPDVLYQFKIDTTGDNVEDSVVQFRFTGTGSSQRVFFYAPSKPLITGTTSKLGRPSAVIGTINQSFSPTSGVSVFAGARSDPFFFDLNRFYGIFPDRETPLTGTQVDYPSIMAADTPQINGFRGFPNGSSFDASPAQDFFANFNVLSIVVELPRASLGGGQIGVWATTSVPNGAPNFTYAQVDREGRPAIKSILATVTGNRHELHDTENPMDDAGSFKSDILDFMNFPAGRSASIANAVASLLIPDVLKADLSKAGNGSYLGVETGGFTGGQFGGRALKDDVIDIDLLLVFGPVIPALGLAPDDGKELPQFGTDNVGPHSDYRSTFPYLGSPH